MTDTLLRERRPLTRAARRRMVAGVGSGLADHLGVRPEIVRVAFVLLTFSGGVGLAMYAAFWVLLPMAPDDGRPCGRRDWLGPAALMAFGLGTLLLFASGGWGGGGSTLFPLAAVALGVGLVWRQADEAQRDRWRAGAIRGRGGALRIGAGGALLSAGLAGFLASRGELGAAGRGLESTAIVVLGLALLSGPWWFRLTGDLREERRERIRSQERAEVAAHLHDSVLQTLALIQKASEDPREVTRLARSQERELRGWLYRGAQQGEGRFGAELERVAGEAELGHGVTVDVVVVGDAPMDARLEAVVAAAREALQNAARHSGADRVSLYAEVETDRASVFVRDRGAGFDPAAVPPDRFGLSGSIQGRMARQGGSAGVRSQLGEGTEVRLEVPRG